MFSARRHRFDEDKAAAVVEVKMQKDLSSPSERTVLNSCREFWALEILSSVSCEPDVHAGVEVHQSCKGLCFT